MYQTDTLVPLQGTISDTIDETVAGVIEFLPTILAAVVILLVGYVIGRVLGGVVTRVVRKIGVGRYAQGTAIEDVSEGDSIARSLGLLVSYYVYFVAVFAAANVLDIPELSDLLGDLAGFLPVILGAVVILVIGFVVGRIVGDIVSKVVGSLGIGPYLQGTPLEQFGDQEGEFGRIVGKLVTYYVYLLTLLTVAEAIDIPELSDLLNGFAAYLPVLAGGLIVLLVGIWLAEKVSDIVGESGQSRGVGLAAVAVKILIYYLTITIVLGTIGFEVAALTTLFTALVVSFFGALGLALAIGIGIAVGLGGQDFVAENIDDWADTVGSVGERDQMDDDRMDD
jgi:hypothetical protein